MEIGFHPENWDIALPFALISIIALLIRKKMNK